VLGAANRVSGIRGHELAHDQEIKAHPDRRLMLLHAWRRVGFPEFLHEGCDVHGLNRAEGGEFSKLASVEEVRNAPLVSGPSVLVVNICREKRGEQLASGLAGGGNEGRHGLGSVSQVRSRRTSCCTVLGHCE